MKDVKIEITYQPAGGFPLIKNMIGNGQCPLKRARAFAFGENAKLLRVETMVGNRHRSYNMQVMA